MQPPRSLLRWRPPVDGGRPRRGPSRPGRRPASRVNAPGMSPAGVQADGGPALGLAPSLLVVTLVLGCFAQGGFRPAGAALVVGASVLVLAAVAWGRPPATASLWRTGLVASGLLAGSAVGSAVAAGVPAGAAPVLAVLVVAGAGLVGAGATPPRAAVLLVDGLLAGGAVVAATAWLGAAARIEPWGAVAEDLWRGSSTLTYANATAALLVVLLVLGTVRLALAELGSGLSPTTVQVLLVVVCAGGVATLSRAAALAGLAALTAAVALAGDRAAVVRTFLPLVPAVLLVGAGLLPGVLASGPARPAAAALGLVAALGAALAAWRVRGLRSVALLVVAGTVVGAMAVGAATTVGGGAADHLAATRLRLGSEDRADQHRAALEEWASAPVLGVGPSQLELRWDHPYGTARTRFVHDEYLELAATQGALGVAALVGAGAVVARGMRAVRVRAPWVAPGAGGALVAAGVHAALDFSWHLPVLVLVAAVAAGLLLADGAERRPG